MELPDKLNALKARKAKQKQYIHSPDHLLADELAKKFHDPGHFGAYLKLAMTHNHDMLRKLAEEVGEQANVRTPAKLFMFLVKKSHSPVQDTNKT